MKNKELELCYEEINVLKFEILKSILGKSVFKLEMFNELIE